MTTTDEDETGGDEAGAEADDNTATLLDSLVGFVNPCLPAYGLQADDAAGEPCYHALPACVKRDYDLAVCSALQALSRLCDRIHPPAGLPAFTLDVRKAGRDS